ncbi:HAD family hydrolase [Oscillatoria sp. FACHB-1407]|uniref:HAD-IA family hydrolase n=1 Tax=Oscillatoria sp. FACHB-1407 TaxID=2692847 RepID=UPI00168475B8|nr:HAD family hydrolase [Oscillatoria sp. FACHB-1407]MBD2461292.1 HAD family hydrolase [Oscillatoria sp. FACHB-1407]
MNYPQVIFFDAVGTLFGVRGSVGQAYSNLAQQFGVTADPQVLNEGFFKAFRAAPPMAFAGVNATYVPEREYAWWWAIAAETFQEAGVLGQFSDFEVFFTALYAHFTTAEPWFVYPDTRHTLIHWHDQGVELGIISNFDSRIHAVLDALGLAKYFKSVTISTEVGAAKPDPQLFIAALKKHNCSPEMAWHIGDSYREDYEGAKAAGLRGIWLRRKD